MRDVIIAMIYSLQIIFCPDRKRDLPIWIESARPASLFLKVIQSILSPIKRYTTTSWLLTAQAVNSCFLLHFFLMPTVLSHSSFKSMLWYYLFYCYMLFSNFLHIHDTHFFLHFISIAFVFISISCHNSAVKIVFVAHIQHHIFFLSKIYTQDTVSLAMLLRSLYEFCRLWYFLFVYFRTQDIWHSPWRNSLLTALIQEY